VKTLSLCETNTGIYTSGNFAQKWIAKVYMCTYEFIATVNFIAVYITAFKGNTRILSSDRGFIQHLKEDYKTALYKRLPN
jgi:hypothetical protein